MITYNDAKNYSKLTDFTYFDVYMYTGYLIVWGDSYIEKVQMNTTKTIKRYYLNGTKLEKQGKKISETIHQKKQHNMTFSAWPCDHLKWPGMASDQRDICALIPWPGSYSCINLHQVTVSCPLDVWGVSPGSPDTLSSVGGYQRCYRSIDTGVKHMSGHMNT